MATTPDEAVEQSEELTTSESTATASKKKAGKAKEADSLYGLVLYTDGSAQPTNPGFGGWGMHGYIYSHLPANKGTGNSQQYLLADGYHERASWGKGKSKPDEVKPLHYVNGFGSFTQHVTNNVAEVAAALNGLAYGLERGVKKILIKTDSSYTVKGSTEWLPIWKRNNWIKGDGTPVANKEIWQNLDEKLQALNEKGIDVEVRWVKGHSVHLGNQMADIRADMGAWYSKRGELRSEVHTRQAEGFWGAWAEKHPFICQRRVYFSTVPGTNKPGEYYMGEHGKDDEAAGKRTADGCFSYLKLAKPEDPIEIVRDYQCAVAAGHDVIVMLRLDKLYEPETVNDVLAFGNICFLKPEKHRLDLQFRDEEVLTKAFDPPRLIMRAVLSFNTLKEVFEKWQGSADPGLVSTDLTDLFYEKDEKGANRLKAQFNVGFSSLPITASYGTTDAKQEAKIDLCLGVDLPDRNALKRLEKLQPVVTLVTWMESDKAFRYATIVQAAGDSGIWAGMHSNLRVLDV